MNLKKEVTFPTYIELYFFSDSIGPTHVTLGTAVGAATILFLFGGATAAVLIIFTRHKRKNESKSWAINSTRSIYQGVVSVAESAW